MTSHVVELFLFACTFMVTCSLSNKSRRPDYSWRPRSGKCPIGFQAHGDYCFFKSFPSTWIDADDLCQFKGSSLFEILTPRDQRQLETFMKLKQIRMPVWLHAKMVRDREVRRSFYQMIWIYNGRPVYENREINEESEMGKCVTVLPMNFKWHRQTCNGMGVPVCVTRKIGPVRMARYPPDVKEIHEALPV